jgi:hypothetical protein
MSTPSVGDAWSSVSWLIDLRRTRLRFHLTLHIAREEFAFGLHGHVAVDARLRFVAGLFDR